MRAIATLIGRLRAIGKGRKLYEDLEDELQAHLALKQQHLEAEGVPQNESLRRAHLALGNAAKWKKAVAEEWTFPQIESILSDVRFGTRVLLKSKIFTAVALLTLTFGIGANTAVFSLLNGLLWHNLPVANADELVRIRLVNLPPSERAWTNGRAVPAKERRRISWALFHSLRQEPIFQDVFGIAGQGSFVAGIAGEAHKLQACTVTGSYFPVLGVNAAAGRLLTDSDDVPGGPQSGWGAVISDAAWTRLFDRRAGAIGATITVERVPFTVIGVVPRSFHGVNPGVAPDLWLPVSSFEAMFPKWHWRTDPGIGVLEPMARLRPGLEVNNARQRLASRSTPLLRAVKPANITGDDEKHYLNMKLDLSSAASGYSFLVDSFGPALWTLMAAVGAVLLIAATNLTNLVLARSTARQQEIAVRLALGASARRIRRQLLIENALLATVGTALGILFSRSAAALLLYAAASQEGPIALDVPLDWNVFCFAAAALIAVLLIAGYVPAWTAVDGAIRAGTKQTTGSKMATRFRSGLIVVQVAFSLALVGGAGLLISSMRSVFTEATGFDTAHTTFLSPDLLNTGLDRERMPQAYANILAETRRLPGVRGAAWTMIVPFTGALQAFTIEVPHGSVAPLKDRLVFSHQVTDGYFGAVGIPLLAGHDFPPRGSRAPRASIVSRNLAMRFFGSPEAALGQELKAANLGRTEIIGVAADAKFQDVREPNPLTVYTSYWDQETTLGMTLAVNHEGDATPLIPAVRKLAKQESGRAPFMTVATLPKNIRASLGTERLLTGVLSAFAAFALIISATGIVGLLSYTVQLRRKEIGVRIALGATPSAIAAEMHRRGMVLAGVGLAVGAGLSWGLGRLIGAHLYRVQASDPVVWICTCVLVLVAAVAASAVPAWRAARTDPMTVLRME